MPHTPGPWQAKLGRTLAFDVSIVNGDGFIVARTSESNGPLIAAAPDLLAALKKIADWDGPNAPESLTAQQMFFIARAAITKATKEML